MISAEVIKGVQELLVERGVEQKADEKFSDFVARGLGISARQTEILLESLHEGKHVDEALRAAEIDPSAMSGDFFIQMARVIGTALGRVAPNQKGY